MSRGSRGKVLRSNKRDRKNSEMIIKPIETYEEERRPKVVLRPLNDKQAEYINLLRCKTIVFATGSAGSGKSYVAGTYALKLLVDKQVDNIVLTRALVEAGERLGALPGEVKDKYAPYCEPYRDIFEANVGKGFTKYLIDSEKIQGRPLAYMRSKTFNKSVVICSECYPEGTEILSDKGFVDLKDVTLSSKVAQYEDDGTITFVNPSNIINKDYDGGMVTLKKGRFSLSTTENHDNIYLNKRGELFKQKAKDKVSSNWFLPLSGEYSGESYLSEEEIIINCALQADGHYQPTTSSSGKTHYNWMIQFSKSKKINRFRDAAIALGIDFSEYEADSRGRVRFYIGKYDAKLLDALDDKTFKQDIILSLNSSCLEFILNEVTLWDGSERGLYYSTNKRNIDLIQAVGHLRGRRCRVNKYQDTRDIFKKLPKPNYTLTLVKTNRLTLQKSIQEYNDYSGKVYCVTVPSGAIVIRQNNSVMICGNCQNTTPEQIFLLLTRLGEGSILIIEGDVKQKDIRGTSGLEDSLQVIGDIEGVGSIHFDVEDCVRSEMVKSILKAYEEIK